MKERTNEEWLIALRGAEREKALTDLRAVLMSGLRVTLKQRGRGAAEASIEDFTQEALVKILDKLDTFQGESRFTTWAQRIAVNVAFTELRRRRWRDVSLEEVVGQREVPQRRLDTLADSRPTPEQSTIRKTMLETVGRLIEEELTKRQAAVPVSCAP